MLKKISSIIAILTVCFVIFSTFEKGIQLRNIAPVMVLVLLNLLLIYKTYRDFADKPMKSLQNIYLKGFALILAVIFLCISLTTNLLQGTQYDIIRIILIASIIFSAYDISKDYKRQSSNN